MKTYFDKVHQHYLDKCNQYTKPYHAEIRRFGLDKKRTKQLNSTHYFETTKLDKKLKHIYPRGRVFHALDLLQMHYKVQDLKASQHTLSSDIFKTLSTEELWDDFA